MPLNKPFSLIVYLILSLSVSNSHAQDTSFILYESPVPGSDFTIKMIPVKGGTFRIGNYAATGKNAVETKQVKLSDFWMGAFEITHDQFGIFYKDETVTQGSKADAVTRPTAQYIDLSWNMGKEGGFPVNSLSQDAALMFCRWLYQKTGIFYRLPTEAEWEYTCRAGTNTLYPFGNDAKLLDQYAWFEKNSKNKYQKVGQKKPNPWGFYDMLGNVCEWTLDQYDENYFKIIGEQPVDPVIPPGTRYPRSLRGGSYLDPAPLLANGYRFESESAWNKRDPQVPKSRWWLTDAPFVGFRIVRPRKQPSAEEADKFYQLYLGK
jgi:formylglycine-generating enzyme required for sulfatase activity